MDSLRFKGPFAFANPGEGRGVLLEDVLSKFRVAKGEEAYRGAF
jgi:hypothetical protein